MPRKIIKFKSKQEVDISQSDGSHEEDLVDTLLSNRVLLSIGTKGSGKTHLMLNFLRYAFANELYERYVLILPSFSFEQHDSYSFIDANRKDIFVFEGYNEMISYELMKDQKNPKKRLKTLYVMDDASGESVWHLDGSLKKMITVIRHLDITLWMIVHSASGILSPFLRQNTDAMLLSKITNMKLLENIYEEYLSMSERYNGKEGHRQFVTDFITAMEEKYRVLYIDMRKSIVDYNAKDYFGKK